MKYPQSQFELLKEGLSILKNHFEIDNINPSQLQYLLYQQGSEGQKHNALFINKEGAILNGVASKNKDGFAPLIDFLNENNFPLYPKGCNDNHIETAIKNALKEIK